MCRDTVLLGSGPGKEAGAQIDVAVGGKHDIEDPSGFATDVVW